MTATQLWLTAGMIGVLVAVSALLSGAGALTVAGRR
jgi:hypothetical protein